MDRNALMNGLEQYLTPFMQRPEYQPRGYREPWEYPEWTARNGEMRNRLALPRPQDWSAPIAEAISPTMGAYGLGQGVGNVLMQGGQGNYASAAGELGLLAAGAIMPGPKVQPKQGIRAYHGSPHDFDKFSMEHIGKGEGEQAYGHGLYFAENEGVARTYKEDLTGGGRARWIGRTEPDPVQQYVLQRVQAGDVVRNGAIDVAALKADLRSEVAFADRIVANPSGRDRAQIDDAIRRRDNARAALNSVDDTVASIDPGGAGRLYEVRIDADPADFLDWDKPLSQQSQKVREAISSAGLEPWQVVDPTGMRRGPMTRAEAEQAARGAAEPFMGARGKDVAELAGARRVEFGQQQKADVLRDAGIPGIRYLDQGSRTSGEGTSNYVLFRDDIITIVNKYGIAAAASMYGVDAVNQAMSEAQ